MTRIHHIHILRIAIVAFAGMACEIGEINVSTTGDAGDAGDAGDMGEAGEESTTGLGATSVDPGESEGSSSTSGTEPSTSGTSEGTSSEGTTSAVTSGEDTSTGESSCVLQPDGSGLRICECEDALMGSHDWMFSGCCTEPFGTCGEWCLDHGFGDCLLVAFTVGETCDLENPVLSVDYCEVDVWAETQANALGVRCVCDQP